jgi:hypothetical protein
MATEWRITRGDQQFIAKDLAELKIWAASGKILADDLIQRPGGSEWTYAAETSELDGLIRRASTDGMSEEDYAKQRSDKTLRQIVLLVTGIGVVIAFGVMIMVAMNPPDPKDKDLKQGQFKIEARDALITDDVALRSGPDASSSAITNLDKDQRVTMIRKLKDWYEVQTKDRQTGWVYKDHLLPGYYLAKDEHKKWDPLYNPENYLKVNMNDWQVVMEEYKPQDVEHLTILSITIANSSQYDMTRIELEAHFWDPVNEVKTEQISLEETVPANGSLYHELEFEVNIEEVPRATIELLGATIVDPPVR